MIVLLTISVLTISVLTITGTIYIHAKWEKEIKKYILDKEDDLYEWMRTQEQINKDIAKWVEDQEKNTCV